MLFDDLRSDTLKALVGNVEWIFANQFFNEYLRIVFRVDGKLTGLQISHRPMWTKYGHRSVEHSDHYDYHIEPMDRDDILAVVSLEDKSRLTESERAEWEKYCEAEAQKKARLEKQKEEMEIKNKRRQLEQLKKEFGE